MRNSTGLLFLALFGMLLPTVNVLADQVSLGASKDNTLFESTDGSLSNGIGDYIYSGKTLEDSLSLRRAVIAFDIAGNVPAGATITSVTLQLNVSKQRGGTHLSSLHRLTSDWGEGTSNSTGDMGGGKGAPATTNDATWLHAFFSATNWTTAGGDFVPQGSATVEISGNGQVVWASTATLVSDVQSWLDTPATNFGWIVLTDESTTPSAKRFDSKENSRPANRPTLLVVYEGTAVESAEWSAIKALFR